MCCSDSDQGMRCLAVWCPLRGTGEDVSPPDRCVACWTSRPGAVHLQLGRLEHEGDDQRHQQGSGHTVKGVGRRSRSWGPKRCFTIGLIVYGIGALMSAVIGLTGEQPGDNTSRGANSAGSDIAALEGVPFVRRQSAPDPGVLV